MVTMCHNFQDRETIVMNAPHNVADPTQKMRRGAPEITMLELSVARSSLSETTGDVSVREAQASSSPLVEPKTKSTRKRRQKENDVDKVVDMSKLRGRQRITALEALGEVIQSLPVLSDIKEEASRKCKAHIESLDRILDVLGDDASQLSLNALGNFEIVALNPGPFADALEEAAKAYEVRSPDASESKKAKELLRSKLKTSTSLIRVNSCVTPSGQKPSTSIVAKQGPRLRNAPTPLRNRKK